MACEMMGGSCSLCPYLDSINCPHYKENKESQEKVCAYVVNRRSSTYTTIASNKKRESITMPIKNFLRNKRNLRPSYIENDLIEITITDGDCNWNKALYLVYNVETKKFYQHYPYSNIVSSKEWDGKVVFSKYNNK